MADLNLSYAHGQSPEAARVHFETAVTKAAKQFGFWIRSVEWDAGRTSARLTGPGYSVLTRVDDTHVHAEGSIPIPLGFLEGPVRRFLGQTLPPKPG